MVKFKCNLCGFETDDAITFASHILSAHTEIGSGKAVKEPQTKLKQEYYECVLCDAKFLTPEELEEHYMKEHPKEYQKALKEVEKKYGVGETTRKPKETKGKTKKARK